MGQTQDFPPGNRGLSMDVLRENLATASEVKPHPFLRKFLSGMNPKKFQIALRLCGLGLPLAEPITSSLAFC